VSPLRIPPVITAGLATLLFTSTLGVLAAVASFGVVRLCTQILEALSYLPPRWGEGHLQLLMEIAMAMAVPVVLWFAVWFYQKALVAERNLAGYRYNPPNEPTTTAAARKA
jgi:hypothetical protein